MRCIKKDDYDFYIQNIDNLKSNKDIKSSLNQENLKPSNIVHESSVVSFPKSFQEEMNSNIIYYISDIHLDHKLLEKFPKYTKKDKIVSYIHDIVQNMLNGFDIHELPMNRYLIINGDVSYNFEITKIFYQELVGIKKPYILPKNIIVVLGNHELWEFNSIEIAFEKFRTLFNELKITFLQNELLVVENTSTFQRFKLNEQEIINLSKQELRNKCLKSNLLILGGLGFSGYNYKYNSQKGLYKNAIHNIDEDREMSKRFEKIYTKLKNTLFDNRLIILTHTPKSDWSIDNYNSNWIYVNGHTHRNEYFKEDEKTIYADNQIGYDNKDITLKKIDFSKKYDIFRYYKDGIYDLDIETYRLFNRGIGIRIDYNRKDGYIKMLKKDGLYCFLLQKDKKELFILNGGQRKKLNNNQIDYYYKNMTIYSNLIKEATKEYNQFLSTISNFIKCIGGYGTIHGCIVDIDFNSHVYVNPFDGTIHPYYAYNIIDKHVCNNFETLLEKHCHQIYLNYQKVKQDKSIISLNTKQINKYEFQLFKETNIYKPSNIMKSIQYLTNDNIIRLWNDEIIIGEQLKKSNIKCNSSFR